jgi:hypothetical protein
VDVRKWAFVGSSDSFCGGTYGRRGISGAGDWSFGLYRAVLFLDCLGLARDCMLFLLDFGLTPWDLTASIDLRGSSWLVSEASPVSLHELETFSTPSLLGNTNPSSET